MPDKTKRVHELTLLDWPNPPLGTDTDEVEKWKNELAKANWWLTVARKVLPRIVRKLQSKFGDRFGISTEQAAGSAVRVFLEQSTNLRFENIDEIESFLYTVAWRKAKAQLDGEHLSQREIGDVGEVTENAFEYAASTGYDDACIELNRLAETLNSEERIVLQGRLEGKTHSEIANAQGWLKMKVDTIWRRITRKVRNRFKKLADDES